MKSWSGPRKLVLLGLIVNAIVLVGILVTGPTVQRLAIPIVSLCALSILAVKKDAPFQPGGKSDRSWQEPRRRGKAILASLVFLGVAAFCIVWSIRTEGTEAIFFAMASLPSLYLGVFGLWASWSSYR